MDLCWSLTSLLTLMQLEWKLWEQGSLLTLGALGLMISMQMLHSLSLVSSTTSLLASPSSLIKASTPLMMSVTLRPLSLPFLLALSFWM